MDFLDVLNRENNSLQQQIQVVTRQLQIRKTLKDKYKELEAEEEVLRQKQTFIL